MAAAGESNMEHGERLNNDDEEEGCPTELMALVVTDDFPVETITKILEGNEEGAESLYLWLADSYDTIPDSKSPYYTDGTATPINENWRSPFIGQSLRQVAEFVRNAPNLTSPVDKRYCAVLRRDEY